MSARKLPRVAPVGQPTIPGAPAPTDAAAASPVETPRDKAKRGALSHGRQPEIKRGEGQLMNLVHGWDTPGIVSAQVKSTMNIAATHTHSNLAEFCQCFVDI